MKTLKELVIGLMTKSYGILVESRDFDGFTSLWIPKCTRIRGSLLNTRFSSFSAY